MNRYDFFNAYGAEVIVQITNGVYRVQPGGTVRLENLDTNELAGGCQLFDGTNQLAVLDFDLMSHREMKIVIGHDPSSGVALRFNQGDVTAVWIWYVAGVCLGMGLMFWAAKVRAIKSLATGGDHVE